MKRRAIALATAALLTTSSAGAKEQTSHLYGPPPSWAEFREIAQSALEARLVDPDSAKIMWIDGYAQGEFKPFLEPRIAGYYACGEVNARNRMGGYAGSAPFVVVVDYGRALFVEMANKGTDLLAAQCHKLREQGMFPPLETMPGYGGAAANSGAASALGMVLRAMPEGAYVASVLPGSTAASAGLKPGMVIGTVNAIPLAGMGEAMTKVIDAAGTHARLAIIGGATVTLGGGGQ